MAKAISPTPEMIEVGDDLERVLLFRHIDEPGRVLWTSTRDEAEHEERFDAFADRLQSEIDTGT